MYTTRAPHRGQISPDAAFQAVFPNAAFYRDRLRSAPSAVRERPAPEALFPYSERHLQCVWADPAYRPPVLRTAEGEEVTVIEPGRWNLEAGPDFLDADILIEPGHRRVKGDVEIHIRACDWTLHGHGADPRYRNVAVHVTYHPGGLPREELPAGALQISLRNDLLANPAFSFENIDVTAYPYARHSEPARPCAEALRSWPPPERERILLSAGEERLRIKAMRLATAIEAQGTEQALYEEVLAGLGYQHNRSATRLLARTIPVQTLRERSGGDPYAAYALLLGAAGLLPTQLRSDWDQETQALMRRLWDHWWKSQSAWATTGLSASSWRLANLRPQNHPRRRLAAAAGLFGGRVPLAEALAAIPADDPGLWFRKAAALLEAPMAIPYWRDRLSLGGKLQKAPVALLGAGRVAALLANAAIPFLAAAGRNIAPLLPHLPAEEENSLVRQTAYALFGHDHNPAMYRSGLKQQGLLQIFHDFCLSDRAECRNCPLAAAIRETESK